MKLGPPGRGGGVRNLVPESFPAEEEKEREREKKNVTNGSPKLVCKSFLGNSELFEPVLGGILTMNFAFTKKIS